MQGRKATLNKNPVMWESNTGAEWLISLTHINLISLLREFCPTF